MLIQRGFGLTGGIVLANFRTHLGIGTVVAGLLATLALATAIVTANDVIAVALAGVLGGILPDIDLQESRPSRLIFFFLGLFLSFCVLFSSAGGYSIAELWLIWLGTFLGVRYAAQSVFHKFARHRGVFHSVLAGVFFLLLTVFIFNHLLGKNSTVSWLAGIFLFVGYMVHLALDELYSVDFSDNRIKRSFGTALKLFEHRNLKVSGAMAAATVAVFVMVPSVNAFVDDLRSRDLGTLIVHRLLPEGHWFGIDPKFEKFKKAIRGSHSIAATPERKLDEGAQRKTEDAQSPALAPDRISEEITRQTSAAP